MTQEYARIVFKLYGLSPPIREDVMADRRMEVVLVGSIPELGSWQLQHKLIAEPSETEENVWTVTSRLPTSSTFRWMWLVLSPRGRVLHTDLAGNRQTFLGLFSGIIESTWDLAGTHFVSQTSAIKMRVRYDCEPGDVMAIIGSGESLGCWDPKKAIIAEEIPDNSSNWVAEAYLDSTVERYESKWVVMDKENGRVKRFEEGKNRHYQPKCDTLQTFDTRWNCETVLKNQVTQSDTDFGMANPNLPSQSAAINSLNNDNCLEPPFNDGLARMKRNEEAERKPAYRSFIRRLPVLIRRLLALLPFIYDWCRI